METQPQLQPQLPFKAGERIAVQSLPLARIDVTNDVAVLSKVRPGVVGRCGARHETCVRAPFFVRGGFRVERREICVVDPDAFLVKVSTPGGSIGSDLIPHKPLVYENCDITIERVVRDSLGERYRILETEVRKAPRKAVMYYRKFRHGEWMHISDRVEHWWRYGDGEWRDEVPWMVYEFITPTEAKLVDDVSRIDYVMLKLHHAVESRSFCAAIKLLGGNVIWHDTKDTCCRINSVAVGIIIARYGSRITLAFNSPPYRGAEQDWRVEVWEMVFPPRVVARHIGVPKEDLAAYATSEELQAEDIV